jgi:uncharacterized Fe-S cluster-containing protein
VSAQEERAVEVVRLAQSGELGRAGVDLCALFSEAVSRGQRVERMADDERHKREAVEREANALAAILADVLEATSRRGQLDAAELNRLVAPVPHDARRRVLAYRHKLTAFAGVPPMDQSGPLPRVPPRAAVLRESVRTVTIDMDPL